MKKYRRLKIALTVAMMVWKKFKGPWQVRVLHENQAALLFWERAITDFIGQEPVFFDKTIEDEHWRFFHFESTH